jgi:hypothetical protein
MMTMIAITAAVTVIGCACTKEKPAEGRITAAGSFSLKGNMPFVRLYFTADDGRTFEVAPAQDAELSALQGKHVRVSGTARRSVLETADGKIRRETWVLRDIKVEK